MYLLCIITISDLDIFKYIYPDGAANPNDLFDGQLNNVTTVKQEPGIDLLSPTTVEDMNLDNFDLVNFTNGNNLSKTTLSSLLRAPTPVTVPSRPSPIVVQTPVQDQQPTQQSVQLTNQSPIMSAVSREQQQQAAKILLQHLTQASSTPVPAPAPAPILAPQPVVQQVPVQVKPATVQQIITNTPTTTISTQPTISAGTVGQLNMQQIQQVSHT